MLLTGSLGSPLLKPKSISQVLQQLEATDKDCASSISVVQICYFLFAITIASYLSVWWIFSEALHEHNTAQIQQLKNFAFASGVLAFSMAILASIKIKISTWVAPIYAIFSGIFLSGLSIAAEQKYPGIAILTVEITAIIFLINLVGLQYKIFRPNDTFKSMVYSLTATVALIYLLSFIGKLFDFQLPILHEAGVGGIIWSAFIVVLASMNVLIDIDKIIKLDNNLPNYAKWRLALGLMVTLVWLYFSVLRLLMKVKR